MERLSTIVFNPDTTHNAEQLMKTLRPLLHVTRDDRLEMTVTERPHPDGGDEVTIYVIIHTGNIAGMIEDLRDIGMY
ncbi:hypothetical protein RCMENCHIE_133 [Rhodobacter phage RcMenchie]|nr:hypothetical protein RCMENCHIE_133 [Rhodobacter phage RcMenchie]